MPVRRQSSLKLLENWKLATARTYTAAAGTRSADGVRACHSIRRDGVC
jgi:hypothetical protein